MNFLMMGLAGIIVLSWTPPTHNTDGSVLMDLSGFNVYMKSVDNSVFALGNNIKDSKAVSTVLYDIKEGKYHIVMTAYNVDNHESEYSIQIEVYVEDDLVVYVSIPMPPTNVVAKE